MNEGNGPNERPSVPQHKPRKVPKERKPSGGTSQLEQEMQTLQAIKDLLSKLLEELRSMKKELSEPRLALLDVFGLEDSLKRKIDQGRKEGGDQETINMYEDTLPIVRKYRDKLMESFMQHMITELDLKPKGSERAAIGNQ